MPQNVHDLITTPAYIYYSPKGTALPADTVPFGTAWDAPWTFFGWTGASLEANYTYEELKRMIEQSLGAVRKYKTSHAFIAKATLAEYYLDGVQLGTGGVVTDTAAGAGQPGKETLDVGDVALLEEKQWGFEGGYVDEDGATFPIRIIFYIATAKIAEARVFGRTAETFTILEIEALSDMSKASGQRFFKEIKILEPAA